MKPVKGPDHWIAAILVALALAFITSIPQLYLCYERGQKWSGSFATFDMDELAYSAYANALVDGRPRRNDPYNGTENQDFESLFSIQFLPPYVLSSVARMLNLSVSTTFVLLLPLIVIFSALIIFKLTLDITQHTALSVACSVGALVLSALTGPGTVLPFLPFSRRYVPAFPFPICLVMFLFVWRSVTRRSVFWPICAGLSFVLLIYSYFFLWTAALAWLVCLAALWITLRRDEWKNTLRASAIIASLGSLGILPYVWLVSHRANTMDDAQVLELSRTPHLFRLPEIGSYAILALIVWLARSGRIAWRDRSVLFLSAFALAPILILNQQVLTGRSLQPFHYQQFIADYMVLIAAFLLLGIAWRAMPRIVPTTLTVASLSIVLAISVSATHATHWSNASIDQKRAVALSIKEENNREIVFSSDPLLSTLIPTEAANPVLWSRYSSVFGNITPATRRQMYFKYLYYSGFDEAKLTQALQSDFTTRVEVFGAERSNPALSVKPQEIEAEEIAAAGREFSEYCALFGKLQAANPRLGYAIVFPNDDLTNLDRWYSRDQGRRVGDIIIYRLTPK